MLCWLSDKRSQNVRKCIYVYRSIIHDWREKIKQVQRRKTFSFWWSRCNLLPSPFFHCVWLSVFLPKLLLSVKSIPFLWRVAQTCYAVVYNKINSTVLRVYWNKIIKTSKNVTATEQIAIFVHGKNGHWPSALLSKVAVFALESARLSWLSE